MRYYLKFVGLEKQFDSRSFVVKVGLSRMLYSSLRSSHQAGALFKLVEDEQACC